MAKDVRPETDGRGYWIVLGLAVALVGFFVFFSWTMMKLADDSGVSETIWSRYVHLFGAVEAIVFTAVGWLFGREVHRSAVESATKQAADSKQEADQAKQKADDAKRDAERGHALAVAVRAAAPSARGVRSAMSPELPSPSTDMSAIVRLAEELFPSVTTPSTSGESRPNT